MIHCIAADVWTPDHRDISPRLRRDEMGRVLKCSDVHLGCKFEVRGETEDEILQQHAEHAKKEHRLTEIRPEDWESARKAIREDEGRKVAGI
jgi:predicted small metal-binding protein